MLPPFDDRGDLPVGVHQASWADIAERLGVGVVRQHLLRTLKNMHRLAVHTRHLERLVVFGSFVTSKEAPGDLDVVLIMDEGFRLEEAPRETRVLFAHADADARFGASVFWIRRGILPDSEVAAFLDFWQTRRDGGRRGIVEVIA